MYYRRKILLSLLELFGSQLKRTDLQKLMFLYCQVSGQNHYDFFPYKFGCFSFLLSQDKLVLEKYGYLIKQDDFKIKKSQNIFNKQKRMIK